MRALQARMVLLKSRDQLSAEEEAVSIYYQEVTSARL